MSPCDRVTDAADLRTASDDIDYPFWNGLSGMIRLVVVISEGALPLFGEEVLEMTSLEEFDYL